MLKNSKIQKIFIAGTNCYNGGTAQFNNTVDDKWHTYNITVDYSKQPYLEMRLGLANFGGDPYSFYYDNIIVYAEMEDPPTVITIFI